VIPINHRESARALTLRPLSMSINDESVYSRRLES